MTPTKVEEHGHDRAWPSRNPCKTVFVFMEGRAADSGVWTLAVRPLTSILSPKGRGSPPAQATRSNQCAAQAWQGRLFLWAGAPAPALLSLWSCFAGAGAPAHKQRGQGCRREGAHGAAPRCLQPHSITPGFQHSSRLYGSCCCSSGFAPPSPHSWCNIRLWKRERAGFPRLGKSGP